MRVSFSMAFASLMNAATVQAFTLSLASEATFEPSVRRIGSKSFRGAYLTLWVST